MTAACEADTLLTKLPCIPVQYFYLYFSYDKTLLFVFCFLLSFLTCSIPGLTNVMEIRLVAIGMGLSMHNLAAS